MSEALFKSPKNKTPLTRISTAMALVVAVFLQMGFVSVTTMECFSSGKDKIFLGENKSCCASEAPNESQTLTPQCCDVSVSSATFYTYKPSQGQSVDFDISAAIPLGLPERLDFEPVSFFQRFAISHLKVPPVSGRQILILFCKYTI